MLDEPTNDVDTDMLAAMEDLLDSWPGTLLVVSHDRYLLERVTDQQYAILGGRLRHVPGGVDEYLRLRQAQDATRVPDSPMSAPAAAPGPSSAASGAQARATQKEISAVERRLQKLAGQIDTLHGTIAAHDQGDYVGLGALTAQLRELEDEVAAQEERWLELSEQLD